MEAKLANPMTHATNSSYSNTDRTGLWLRVSWVWRVPIVLVFVSLRRNRCFDLFTLHCSLNCPISPPKFISKSIEKLSHCSSRKKRQNSFRFPNRCTVSTGLFAQVTDQHQPFNLPFYQECIEVLYLCSLNTHTQIEEKRGGGFEIENNPTNFL